MPGCGLGTLSSTASSGEAGAGVGPSDPPATLEPIHSHLGVAAVVKAVAEVAQTLRTEHAIVGEVYDRAEQPGAARGRIACIAHHWRERADSVNALVWHLRYRDDYEFTDRGWRIRRRTLTINAIETRPVRLVRPPEGR